MKGAMYRSDRDRARSPDTLSANVVAHHIRLYAYVLMANHHHLLMETPENFGCTVVGNEAAEGVRGD